MTTSSKALWRVLLVHAGLYVTGALLLLAAAFPVDWDTPSNLEYTQGWTFLLTLVAATAVVLGTLEGGTLRVGPVALGWLLAALAAGVGLAGASFFIDPFQSAADSAGTGRSDVVMSQLMFALFWLAQTLVVGAWVRLLRPRVHAQL